MKTWCKGIPTSQTFIWKHVMSQFEYALWGKEKSSVESAEKYGILMVKIKYRISIRVQVFSIYKGRF